MTALNNDELKKVSGGALFEGETVPYILKKGDTVESLAIQFKTKPLVLQELNPMVIDDSMQIKPGTVSILVPRPMVG